MPILIQIAFLAGFTPTASIVQFSPCQPSPLSVSFIALHCLHACMLVVYSLVPPKGHGTGLFQPFTCLGPPGPCLLHNPCTYSVFDHLSLTSLGLSVW